MRNFICLTTGGKVFAFIVFLCVLLLVSGCKGKIEAPKAPPSSIKFSSSLKDTIGDNAFDGNGTSFWETVGAFPHWIQKDFGTEKKITKYVLQTGPHGQDSTGRMPRAWKLQGSNDGVKWVDLDKRENETGWKNDEGRSYDVSNPSTYRYYRFYFTSGIDPTILRIYEIKLME